MIEDRSAVQTVQTILNVHTAPVDGPIFFNLGMVIDIFNTGVFISSLVLPSSAIESDPPVWLHI